ncbi:unnamed protein product [Calypogeia fissa]
MLLDGTWKMPGMTADRSCAAAYACIRAWSPMLPVARQGLAPRAGVPGRSVVMVWDYKSQQGRGGDCGCGGGRLVG